MSKHRTWLLVVSSLFLLMVAYVGLSGSEEVADGWGPVSLKECVLTDDASGVVVGLDAENTHEKPVSFSIDVGVFYDSPGQAESQLGEKSFDLKAVDPGATAQGGGQIDISGGEKVDDYGYRCAIVNVRES